MTYEKLRLLDFIERDTERICHTLAISRIGLQAVADVADLDEFGRIAHGAGGILEQHLLLRLAHQAEELAGLGVIIGIILAEIPAIRCTRQVQCGILEFGLFLPLAKAVRFVADGGAVIAIHAHLAIPMGGIAPGHAWGC